MTKMNGEQRRSLYASLVKQILSGMTPNCYGKFSGQQVSYAKGRAWQRMQELGA